VINGFPTRQIARQQPPGTPTSNNIEDGVEDFAY